MDILLQTIISEFSIKAPQDPKNPPRLDLTTIEGVAAIFATFATRRFGWPMATLLPAPAVSWEGPSGHCGGLQPPVDYNIRTSIKSRKI